LAAVVALAALVRCHYLAEVSYDFDEAFTWKMTTFPAGEIWTRVARDNHPPLVFYVLRGWSRLFGDSPGAMRSFNLALGLVAVIGAYLLVRQVTRSSQRNLQFEVCDPQFAISQPSVSLSLPPSVSPMVGRLSVGGGTPQRAFPTDARMRELPALAAAALVAFSPYQIDFSQQVRMGYVLGAALTILSCWLFLRALQAGAPRWRDYVLYALAAAALAYTHHFGLFILAGQFLYGVGYVALRGGESIGNAHRCHLILAFVLILLLWLPWASSFLRQRQQVSDLFHTKPFAWNEVAKACYQTLAVRWEDDPPSERIAWAATAACLLPPLAMLIWGRGGLRLIGLCVLATFDGAICTSIGDRNIIQSRYFVFANALLLCGLPPLMVWHTKAKRERGTVASAARPRFGRVLGATTLAALVAGQAWLCLAHAQRREGFARRPGMMGAMAYLDESRQPGEPVLVCNPLLQVTATAHAARTRAADSGLRDTSDRPHPNPLPQGEGEEHPHPSPKYRLAGAEGEGEIRVQVLSSHTSFPYFQGTAVMREEDYLSPEALIKSSARRVWVIDATNWIIREWRLPLPLPWIELSEMTFPEGAAAENGRIIVRCYQRKMSDER
jgi:mannosyltransferase